VARRLAHEIKNPLTPIQLSAERLQMKLEDKLEAGDAALLARATSTIVNQVDAMKRMVDDFRDYARTPPAVLEPLDLNGLIEQILNLYLAEDASDIIHAALAPDLPQVMGDATQLRQVIHNLLQNAQDALVDRGQNASTAAPAPRIDVATEIIHYTGADGTAGTAVRLEPGDSTTVRLIPLGGDRVVHGFRDLVDGPLDPAAGVTSDEDAASAVVPRGAETSEREARA